MAGGQGSVRPEYWAIQAESWANSIEHQKDLAKKDLGTQLDEKQEIAIDKIDKSLKSVRETIAAKRRYLAPVDYWRGISRRRTYRGIHAANILLVELFQSDHLETKVRSVTADARATLDPDDPRLLEINRLIGADAYNAHGDTPKSAQRYRKP